MSPEETASLIKEWQDLTAWLSRAKSRELELRKWLAAFFVPNPAEGTNKVETPDYVVKVGYKLSRDYDAAQLDAVFGQLPEGLADKLIKWTPELATKEYRKLDDNIRQVVDQCLVIKPSTPTLEIVPKVPVPSGPSA